MKRVLSFGAGIQSTTLLFMACLGVIPKFDAVVFADTGWEPQSVYDHLEWCKGEAERAGMTINVVSKGNIFIDAMNSRLCGSRTEGARWVSMPYFLKSPTGKEGKTSRQCTSEYKIGPLDRFVRRKVLGLKPRQHAPKEAVVLSFQGISIDEAGRMKAPRNRWQTFVYPFCRTATHHPDTGLKPSDWLELPNYYSRDDCKRWLAENYPDIRVPRSACLGCPFHNNAEWKAIKERPDEWATVVQLDRHIRAIPPEQRGMMQNEPYLHWSRIPIEDVDFTTQRERSEDAGQLNWINECEGMCGV